MMDPDPPRVGTEAAPPEPDDLAAIEVALADGRDTLARIPELAAAAQWVAEHTAAIFGAATTLELAAESFSSPPKVRSWSAGSPGLAENPGPPVALLGLPLRARQRAFGELRLIRHGAATFAEPVKQLLSEWSRHAGLVLDGLLLQEELGHARSGLQRVDQRLQDLVARIGHDLRAPMGAVLMWLHVARQAQQSAQQSDRNDALDAIEAGAREQNVLISELVDLTRARVGRLELHRTTIRLPDLVDEVVLRTALQAQKRGIRVERLAGAPGVGALRGDQPRLLQSLLNVVSHAIRVSPSDRRIVLACAPEAGWARLEIRNAFAEVDLPALEKLLLPFSPAGLFAERDAMAVDLRLSYAHEMVALHGGTLSAFGGPPVAVVIRLPLTHEGGHPLMAAEPR